MKHILWLTSWYPDKLQPLNGDFIERHAKAASLYNRITVLHVVKDDRSLTRKNFQLEKRKYNENCSATILYYKPFSKVASIEKLFAGLRYFIFFSALIREHINEFGKPALMHVHVAWRAGLLALYYKWKYRIPYLLSEHWTAFLPDASPSVPDKFPAKIIIRSIFQKAAKVSAVSVVLADALQQKFKIKTPVIIPNVVDTNRFAPGKKPGDSFVFVHISEMTKAKNAEQILQAIALVAKKTSRPFRVDFYGPNKKSFIDFTEAGGIGNFVRFIGHVPHDTIAKALSAADCLLLYSTYETFGCVIIEANACGLPVIVSDIPVMHEVVNERTGIFAELNDPVQLAEKMMWMMENHLSFFNRDQIAMITKEKYGMETVGKKFAEFYGN